MVYGGLNKIYYNSRDISKEWGLPHIPILTFREIIDKSKLKAEDSGVEKFIEQYNKTLDIMFTTCTDQAKKLGTENISLKFIKMCVQHVKDNMHLK